MNDEKIKLHPEWKAVLAHEFDKPYMQELREFLGQEATKGKRIYPKGSEIFSAFNHTPLSKVKVVVLGQDPYHGPGQAHGLSFSVQPGVRPPPSLRNIFKELKEDLQVPMPAQGDLSPWADQGVLLLNTVLTVEEGRAASHRNLGWERFTDRVIEILSERDDPLVFLLWGKFAHDKAAMIRVPPHKILKAPHPSPLSAYTGYFGSRPFSSTNEILRSLGKPAIDWSLR